VSASGSPATNGNGGGPRVAGLKDIVLLVEEDLRLVEELFEEQVRSDIGLVGEIGRYVRDGGGKRIRPALLLLAARACGYRGPRAVLLAGVVEFIHSATLLHDDIIDQATLRRGRKSVNSRWGNDVTVLLGDFLYTKAMGMALSQDNLPILRLLSDVTLRMTEGQLLEIQRFGDVEIDESGHTEIIRRKTADLFSACTQNGAKLGDVGDERERALASYGLNLGICFQMVDDLLDFTADEKVLGKPVANDLREGKVTLPVVFLLRRNPAALPLVRRIVKDPQLDDGAWRELLAMVRDSHALHDARQLAERYADNARRELSLLDRSPFTEALQVLPDFIIARDH
jgi:octaprenyl-diphosphate synthase